MKEQQQQQQQPITTELHLKRLTLQRSSHNIAAAAGPGVASSYVASRNPYPAVQHDTRGKSPAGDDFRGLRSPGQQWTAITSPAAAAAQLPSSCSLAKRRNTCSSVVWLRLYSSMPRRCLAETSTHATVSDEWRLDTARLKRAHRQQ